jgi:hypothetical protein
LEEFTENSGLDPERPYWEEPARLQRLIRNPLKEWTPNGKASACRAETFATLL